MIPVPGRLPLKLAVGAGCLMLLALLVQDRDRWKAKASHYAEVLAGERAAHLATQANYSAAAEHARQTDAANAARVKSSQAAISERSAHDLESRLAAARSAAQRLRRDAATAAADPGSRGATPVPAFSAAPGSASQGTRQDELSRAERLIATEQAIQLDELIKWVRRQREVRVNDAGD